MKVEVIEFVNRLYMEVFGLKNRNDGVDIFRDREEYGGFWFSGRRFRVRFWVCVFRRLLDVFIDVK